MTTNPKECCSQGGIPGGFTYYTGIFTQCTAGQGRSAALVKLPHYGKNHNHQHFDLYLHHGYSQPLWSCTGGGRTRGRVNFLWLFLVLYRLVINGVAVRRLPGHKSYNVAGCSKLKWVQTNEFLFPFFAANCCLPFRHPSQTAKLAAPSKRATIKNACSCSVLLPP